MEIKLNPDGFKQVLKSPEVAAELERLAQTIAGRAGEGYEVVAGTRGTSRSRVFVRPATKQAVKDNAENDTLIRALGGG